MLIDSFRVLFYSKIFHGHSQLLKIPIYMGMLDRDPKSMAMIPNLFFPDPDSESHSAFLNYQKYARESSISV
jgi:hypothetical protein